MKGRQLKKLFEKYQSKKAEVTDLQEQFQVGVGAGSTPAQSRAVPPCVHVSLEKEGGEGLCTGVQR